MKTYIGGNGGKGEGREASEERVFHIRCIRKRNRINSMNDGIDEIDHAILDRYRSSIFSWDPIRRLLISPCTDMDFTNAILLCRWVELMKRVSRRPLALGKQTGFGS